MSADPRPTPASVSRTCAHCCSGLRLFGGGSATSAGCAEIVGIRFPSGLLAGGSRTRTLGPVSKRRAFSAGTRSNHGWAVSEWAARAMMRRPTTPECYFPVTGVVASRFRLITEPIDRYPTGQAPQCRNTRRCFWRKPQPGSWRSWCEGVGEQPGTQKSFSLALDRAGFEPCSSSR